MLFIAITNDAKPLQRNKREINKTEKVIIVIHYFKLNHVCYKCFVHLMYLF